MSGPVRAGEQTDAMLRRLRAAVERNGGLIPDDQAPPQRTSVQARRDEQWGMLMPRKLRPAHVDMLDADDKRGIVHEWLRDPTRNLLLLGALGRGKSTTAAAAARVLHDQGRTVAFWPLDDLLADMGGEFGRGEAYRTATTAHVLIVDDVGTGSHVGSKKVDWIYSVINRRYLDELPTIVTSNSRTRAEIEADPDPDDPDEQSLQDAITDRVYARLTEHCYAAFIGGHDRRAASHR